MRSPLGALRLPSLLLIGLTATMLPLFCRAALPAPDPDDGGIELPPGFRALVFADNLVVRKRVGDTPEKLRGLAVAPTGDVYAKGRTGLIWAINFLRKNFAPSAPPVTAAQVAARRSP